MNRPLTARLISVLLCFTCICTLSAQTATRDIDSVLQRAANDDPEACYQLYQALTSGNGVEIDTIAAHQWLEYAAHLGHKDANRVLAYKYKDGDDGYPKNIQKAIDLFTKAEEWDNIISIYTEEGETKNLDKAIELCKRHGNWQHIIYIYKDGNYQYLPQALEAAETMLADTSIELDDRYRQAEFLFFNYSEGPYTVRNLDKATRIAKQWVSISDRILKSDSDYKWYPAIEARQMLTYDTYPNYQFNKYFDSILKYGDEDDKVKAHAFNLHNLESKISLAPLKALADKGNLLAIYEMARYTDFNSNYYSDTFFNNFGNNPYWIKLINEVNQDDFQAAHYALKFLQFRGTDHYPYAQKKEFLSEVNRYNRIACKAYKSEALEKTFCIIESTAGSIDHSKMIATYRKMVADTSASDIKDIRHYKWLLGNRLARNGQYTEAKKVLWEAFELGDDNALGDLLMFDQPLPKHEEDMLWEIWSKWFPDSNP